MKTRKQAMAKGNIGASGSSNMQLEKQTYCIPETTGVLDIVEFVSALKSNGAAATFEESLDTVTPYIAVHFSASLSIMAYVSRDGLPGVVTFDTTAQANEHHITDRSKYTFLAKVKNALVEAGATPIAQTC